MPTQSVKRKLGCFFFNMTRYDNGTNWLGCIEDPQEQYSRLSVVWTVYVKKTVIVTVNSVSCLRHVVESDVSAKKLLILEFGKEMRILLFSSLGR